MSLIVPSRRRFLTGLGAILAAPAILKASSLMKVKPVDRLLLSDWEYAVYGRSPGMAALEETNYSQDLVRVQQHLYVYGDSTITEGWMNPDGSGSFVSRTVSHQ